MGVVYFDQLSGVVLYQNLVELFFHCFQHFLFILNIFQWFFVWNKAKYAYLYVENKFS